MKILERSSHKREILGGNSLEEVLKYELLEGNVARYLNKLNDSNYNFDNLRAVQHQNLKLKRMKVN